MRKTVQDIPECGKSPDDNNVFGLLYPNGYHCSDMVGNSTTNVAEGVAMFSKALDKWLPCFKEHTVTSGASPLYGMGGFSTLYALAGTFVIPVVVSFAF